MAQTPWIGIENQQPDTAAAHTCVPVNVVEVSAPVDVSDWDRIVRPVISAGRRVLLALPPISPNSVDRAVHNAMEKVGVFRERYRGDENLEGIVLEFTNPDEDTVTRFFDISDEKKFVSNAYVKIDTALPINEYPHCVRILRAACDRGATPYIIRPSDTSYGDSFLHTRYFSAAARLRRSTFVLAATAEPASPASAVSAVFETVTSGAAGLVLSADYFNDTETAQALASAATHLRTTVPTPSTAMLWPSPTDLADRSTADLFHDLAISIRDVTDYDILDERRVCECCLDNYKVVILAVGCCYDRDTLDTVYEWVKKGGALLANCVGTIRCPDGETTFNRDLLDRDLAAPNPAACCTMRRIFSGASFHYCHEAAGCQNMNVSPKDGFVNMVAKVLRRNMLLGAEKVEPDGMLDGIHAARVRDRILLLNVTDETVTQEILLPSAFGTHKVDLPPREITEVQLGDLLDHGA